MSDVQHVFLIGAKSLGTYGGYETFINKLTEYHQDNPRIKYHIACKANGSGCMDPYQTEGAEIISDREFVYHNAHCFRISIPEKLGSAQAIYYDVAAMKESCKIIKEQNISHPIVYIMACRIGPFIKNYYKIIHKMGGRIYLNPDGHEWMRTKWNTIIRKYWKISEQMMVKYSDLCICDSVNIERYIHDYYDSKGIRGKNIKTAFISYGAELRKSRLANDNPKLLDWYKEKELYIKKYYLIVGRFVPENNFETMIREFMSSQSSRDLAIITTADDLFLQELETRLNFHRDKRIKFVGTVYDQELLKKIRENAFAYIHGHEVGGTNPSLLEALGSTDLNLLLDVGFNQEVAADAAVYWTKKDGNLAHLINRADEMDATEIAGYCRRARQRIANYYTWDIIVGRYEALFCEERFSTGEWCLM